MSGPVPRVKKIPPRLTPEQVAAYESMKPNKYLDNQGRPQKKTKSLKHTVKYSAKAKLSCPDPTLTMDIFTLRQQPISDAVLEQLAFRLIKWVMTKKEIIIDDFLEQEGKSLRQFNRFVDRSPKLKEVFDFAKMCIGNKRERDAYYNKGNAVLIMKSMPNYSPRWKDLIKWYAEINSQNQNVNQGIQVVEITKAEKTDIVPPLPKDKNE